MIARLWAWLQASAATLALGMALGGAAKMAWDWHAPFGWGLGQRYEAARTLADERGVALNAAVAGWHKSADEWSAAYDRLAKARQADADAAAEALADRAAAMSRQCQQAFDSGVKAGKAIGAKDACSPAGGGGRPADSDGVPDGDDLADWWTGTASRADP